MKNGKIGVTTENIFPVIKKFLYSDHEIFLRELISNAVDATQKLKTLSSIGEMKGDLGDLTIRVSADKDAKTLTVTDRGIGMTAEEVDKYINQIAFSGAEEFMEKYKNQAIIGHFGLGFYSSFMVADKVEIITKSWKEGAKTVRWSCTGTPEFEMEETDEAHDRGTTIVLHLSEDALEYAEDSKVEGLLRKYCRFLPIPIAFGKVKEWKDGKYVDTDKDNVINNVDPLWTRKPADITEEQYKEFYHELYPMSDEPLFSIHLNIDYPFHLTGILYFPKIHNNFEIQKNKIQLYSNQVYVTDQVEGIVPEYLTLLHGVIDSPDIPLNVSRSYLQSDANVKKISNYITRKVADRLQELFNTMRPDYESKWDDLKIFIQYGILTDEKFAEKAQDFMLWKNVEGKYFTPKEYLEKVKENQTDKNKTVVLLYVDDPVEKHTFLEAARGKGYDVLLMDGQPLCQLVRVEKQGDAFRARGQRCDRQAHPEGGQHQDVAHRSAAGVVAPGIREPDAQGRKDTLQHFVRGDVARRGARGDYAERIHAPYEGDGRSGRRGHEPVLRADARQLHHRGERQPPHRRGHPLRCREGLRRQAEVHHQEDRRGRGRGKPLRGGYQGQERGGAYPRREIHARGVVEEGRHAAR